MQLPLDHVETVAKDIKTFWFRSDHQIRYTAGQFIEMTLPHEDPDDRGEKRWFTLSASPTEAPLISITTRFTPKTGSSFKRALAALKPGDTVKISMPMGDFVLPRDKNRPLLFIAGGIGVTPFRSMIKSLIDAGEERDIQLIYAATSKDQFAFDDILSQPWIKISHHTTRLDAATIRKLVPDAASRLIYTSGPEPMVEALVKEFKKAGIPSHHLIGDYFPNYK